MTAIRISDEITVTLASNLAHCTITTQRGSHDALLLVTSDRRIQVDSESMTPEALNAINTRLSAMCAAPHLHSLPPPVLRLLGLCVICGGARRADPVLKVCVPCAES